MANNALEVGCGPKSRWVPNTDGIDLIDFGQKYVGDFLTYEFPKKYKVVFAHHVLEHQQEPVDFMNKICDILEKGGILDIRVPVLPYVQVYWDPTHKTFIPDGDIWFRYFTDDSPAGHCYSKKKFKINYFEHDRLEWESHIQLTLIE